MKHPDKPDVPTDPRKHLPGYDRPCPNCGDERESWKRIGDVEQIGKWEDRIDKWCPECDEYIGTKLDYVGPVPVRTHTGWELH